MAADDFAMSKKGGDTSGSVLGECGAAGVKLDEMAKCNCVENPSSAFVMGNGTPITPRVSPVIGPSIGARYRQGWASGQRPGVLAWVWLTLKL